MMCKIIHMATNLAIDDGLLEEARKVGGHRTKKATVTEALDVVDGWLEWEAAHLTD